jgi:signal transduction histidine kinase
MTSSGDDENPGAGGRVRRRLPLPGTGDLAALVEAMRAAGLNVELRHTLTAEVPGAAGLAVYRIVQEALTNAMRHAPGEWVFVDVDEDDGGVVVSVTNALPLGYRASPGGHGLRNMRERAAGVGAQIELGVEGPDWRVTLWLTPEAAGRAPA